MTARRECRTVRAFSFAESRRSGLKKPASSASASTVSLGAATINLAQGEATVSLPLVLGDFGPRYPSHDNRRPIVALETQLPLAGTKKTGLSAAGL